MATIKVMATYIYEIEVDETSEYVKEYESQSELISDLVHYQFKVLPVIGNGVTIEDVTTNEYEII